MSTPTNHDTELDLDTIEHLDFEVQCGVPGDQLHGHPAEPHPAHWAAIKACGCSVSVCDEWYRYVRTQNAIGRPGWCGQCGHSPSDYVHAFPIR